MANKCSPNFVELFTPVRRLGTYPIAAIASPGFPDVEPLAVEFELTELILVKETQEARRSENTYAWNRASDSKGAMPA